MKIKNLLLIFILISTILFAHDECHNDAFHVDKRHRAGRQVARGCSNWGFFAEFLWTLNYLEWCVTQNKTPIVKWGNKFAYYSPGGYNGSNNPWEYYFYPVSSLQPMNRDIVDTRQVYNGYFTTIWWYCQYINNIHLLPEDERKSIIAIPLDGALAGNPTDYPVNGQHLYSINFRKFVKEQLINRFVKIKPNIQTKIDFFYREKMEGKNVIGIHLRGKFLGNEVGEVPLEIICEEANRHANENTVFLVATDQYPLLEKAKSLLNGDVIFYDSFRRETTTSPWVPSQCSPEMGEDVLIETILLSQCNHFIHTISNVSTAALYFNPDLPHTMLYCGGAQ